MEREIAFMDAISPDRPEVLPVLERGANCSITPSVEGRPLRRRLFGRGMPKLLTMRQVQDIADLLRYLFSRGYDPIDMTPHNLLVHPSGRFTAGSRSPRFEHPIGGAPSTVLVSRPPTGSPRVGGGGTGASAASAL